MYEGTCIECQEDFEDEKIGEHEVGRYIGESSRTLAEHSGEHMKGAKSLDTDNFIVKHWVLHHPSLEHRPCVRFRVLKAFKDPLSR